MNILIFIITAVRSSNVATLPVRSLIFSKFSIRQQYWQKHWKYEFYKHAIPSFTQHAM